MGPDPATLKEANSIGSFAGDIDLSSQISFLLLSFHYAILSMLSCYVSTSAIMVLFDMFSAYHKIPHAIPKPLL